MNIHQSLGTHVKSEKDSLLLESYELILPSRLLIFKRHFSLNDSKKPACNTDGIFNRFVTVFANRARHVSGELSLGRESEAI
jgi:hypothetical protein